LSNEDPNSTVHPYRVAKTVCGPCHESDRIKERYGIAGKRLTTYIDSYHGLKSSIGDITVATCTSCHGPHDNLPPDDPRSTIYPQNRIKTCGGCHEKITQELAMVPIHRPGVRFETPLAGILRSIYIYLIFIVVGALLIHNLLDLRFYYRKALKHSQVKRMSANEATQHAFLMLTFTTLVVTGFALRHSEAWWATGIFGRESGFLARGLIHRGAAVLFILTSVWHGVYLLTENGRKLVKDMLPQKQDFTDLWINIRRLLGKGEEYPRFGRFTYGEKFEYWAMIWGTIIMTVTGFMLWYDDIIVQYVPKGVLDVTLVIHYFEALLATLAIVVWHFYNVVFNPVVYPMNPSWITGTMPEEVYEHEHPGDKPTA
jgi:formate dehydrogenase gamma subunit